jgi:hypothetical protein
MKISTITKNDIVDLILNKSIDKIENLDDQNMTEDSVQYEKINIIIDIEKWFKKSEENKEMVKLYKLNPTLLIQKAATRNNLVNLSFFQDGEVEFRLDLDENISRTEQVRSFLTKLNNDMELVFKKDIENKKNIKRPKA